MKPGKEGNSSSIQIARRQERALRTVCLNEIEQRRHLSTGLIYDINIYRHFTWNT